MPVTQPSAEKARAKDLADRPMTLERRRLVVLDSRPAHRISRKQI